MWPAGETQVSPRAQLASAIVSIIASAAAFLVATNLPHAASDVLVSGGYFIKEPYYFWMLIGAGESIILGVALIILLMARSRASWITGLTVASAVLGTLVLASAAAIWVSYASARDDGEPAPTPRTTTAPQVDSSDLLQPPPAAP